MQSSKCAKTQKLVKHVKSNDHLHHLVASYRNSNHEWLCNSC